MTGALLGLLVCQPACRSSQKEQKSSLVEDSQLEKQVLIEDLRADLLAYSRYFQTQIELASEEIKAGEGDQKTRKALLLWKLQMVGDVHEADTPLDLIEVLLDTWALTVRITKYFTEGEGKALFGDEQPEAVATATRLQHRIESVAEDHLPPDEFASAAKRVEEYARKNPMTGMFVDELKEEASVPPKHFANWLSAPFRAVGQVGKQLDPTSRLADAVDRFALFLKDYPAQVRVQTQLLLLQAEELESVRAAIQSVESVAESSAELSATAEKWPKRFREEAQILLDDVDKRQAELRATLQEAQRTSETINQAMMRAETTSANIERSLGDATDAADAWRATADATAQVVRELQILTGKDGDSEPASGKEPQGESQIPQEPGEKRPFDIQDYQRTAEALTRSAEEIRGLLSDVGTFVENTTTQRRLEGIDALAASAIGPAATQARSIVDHIAWRIVQLCALVFVLAVVYRLVFRKRRASGG
jgi:hypothetical protein